MNSPDKHSLFGLVICGGRSSRMNTDKSLLEFHGIPQRNYLFNLLKNYCRGVFLSLNKSQVETSENKFSFIKDDPEFCDTGPVNALLSFWKKYPESSILAVGCDYPFIDDETLKLLIANRKGKATCYIHPEENIYEPMLTIYESSFQNILKENFNNKNYSLSRILKQENVAALETPSKYTLLNVNTPGEYFSAKKIIDDRSVKNQIV